MLNFYVLERQVTDMIAERQRDAARHHLVSANGPTSRQRLAAFGRTLASRARHDAACCAEDVSQALGQVRAAGRSQDAVRCA